MEKIKTRQKENIPSFIVLVQSNTQCSDKIKPKHFNTCHGWLKKRKKKKVRFELDKLLNRLLWVLLPYKTWLE